MKAIVDHRERDVRVGTVDDPSIQEPNDAIIRVTSTGICGSDLHLCEVLGPYLDSGDILGHEQMGIVEEVGPDIFRPGDRVVIPFNICCGHCDMCNLDLQSQCETTQVREQDKGAALLGYTKLDGRVPGGQAEGAVRRGGTLSVVGVYGGMVVPTPMTTLFDKQITLRVGQANVKRWIGDILPLLTGDGDPLGVDTLVTHHLPLDDAPQAYKTFQEKSHGAVKILLQP